KVIPQQARRPLDIKSSSSHHERVLESPLPGETRIPNLSLTQYIWQDLDKWVAKPAMVCTADDRSYTYGELRALCKRFANALSALGLKRKEVVGIVLPNIPEFHIVIQGAIEAGLIATFANPLYTPEEIRRQFQNAGVKCTITIPQLLPLVKQIVPTLSDHKATILVTPEDNTDSSVHSLRDLLINSLPEDIPPSLPDDVALLPYSSGTTGLPKGVMHTPQFSADKPYEYIVTHLEFETTQEVVLSVLPFFHIYGFNGILNASIMNGMHVISLPKFTPEDYLSCVIKYRPTVLFVVPSLLLCLATHPGVTKEHLSSIEKVVCGAAPATKNLIDKFLHKIDKDISIRQGYGMTESSPVTLIARRGAPISKVASCGQLVPLTQAKVVDLTTGESLGPHQSGELWIRGPQVMLGYLNNEEATRDTIDSEGWLHTGDVAYYDEDEYFYIVDRTKELIKVKANQVSPTELENILLQMPGITDVAVVGIPDIAAGEVPQAFVVRKPDAANLTEETIKQFVESKVASYKKLAGGVRFIDIIPRNHAGKVLRQQLKVLAEKSPIQ
ncbi:hypothetical protein L9F63_020254, partial [Diploptera punctata]